MLDVLLVIDSGDDSETGELRRESREDVLGFDPDGGSGVPVMLGLADDGS